MKIGIDIMGGDYAPNAILEGVVAFLRDTKVDEDFSLVLYGDEKEIMKFIGEQTIDTTHIEVVPTSQVIEMGESPIKAVSAKKDSSIVRGMLEVVKTKTDAFISSGNTGAMMAALMGLAKPVEGVLRPSIASPVPRFSGKKAILLDVGLNADCKPEYLLQFALMGKIYMESVYGIKNPTVGLLNIGSEPSKGNLLAKATYPLLEQHEDINFIGNVEGKDIYTKDTIDIVLADGFTGNVVLKEAESFYYLIKKATNDSVRAFDVFNFENYGAVPVLGVQPNVLIGHGVSTAKAVKNQILHAIEVINSDFTERIIETFKNA